MSTAQLKSWRKTPTEKAERGCKLSAAAAAKQKTALPLRCRSVIRSKTMAVISESPSLAFLRFEQARRELSSKRTDALRRRRLELDQQKKQADALEHRRALRVAAIEKAWERRQLVVRVSYMVRVLIAVCHLKPKHPLSGVASRQYCCWLCPRMGFGGSPRHAGRGQATIRYG
jgi:hypothetical protein